MLRASACGRLSPRAIFVTMYCLATAVLAFATGVLQLFRALLEIVH
jgi:hypothetical protein